MFAPRSDEEHIERLRRNLATFDRWRRPLVVLYVVLALAFVGLLVGFVVMFEDLGRNWGKNAAGMWPGFAVGLAVGGSLGLMALKIGHGLVDLLLGYRNERLLIQYHEVLRASRVDDPEASHRKFQVALYPSDEGVAVCVPSLPGCWSQGETEEEALANIEVAIREYLETEADSTEGAERREVEVLLSN